MKIKNSTIFEFVLGVLLIIFVLIILFGGYSIQKDIKCPTNSQEIIPLQNDSLIEELNNLKLRYSQLEDEYHNWVNITHRIYDEKEFWKEQDNKKSNELMLCWNKNIDVPDKSLVKREVCKEGCYYKLYCTDSMKPLFDCTDNMMVYTNVEKDEIGLCDVIGFRTPDTKYDWIIHRVINITDEGYVTKGDSYGSPDKYIVKFEDVIFKLIEVKYG